MGTWLHGGRPAIVSEPAVRPVPFHKEDRIMRDRIISAVAAAALAAIDFAPAPAGAASRLASLAPLSPSAQARAAHGHDVAHATSQATYWRDATLDCYPTGGGIVGGGTNNQSVQLSIFWKWPTNTIVWAGHRVIYEVYINHRGPFWQRVDGTYGSNTSRFYGPYRIGPQGVVEWSQPYYNFDGSYGTAYTPWSDEATFAKSDSTFVRAWVGLQTYSRSTGWSHTTWHLASPLHRQVGVANGFCSL
jgi:hypothetical protein